MARREGVPAVSEAGSVNPYTYIVTKRRWTILIVPHDSESPRQYEIGEGSVRAIAGAIGAAAVLVLAAAVMLFSPWATPGARIAARDANRLRQEVARLDASLLQLGDSMDVLATREAEFREIAGITTFDSAHAVSNPTTVRATDVNRADVTGARPKPFAQFFGNRSSRPDPDALIRRASELSSALSDVADTMTARIEKMRNTPSIMPTSGWLSSAFSKSRLHPILHERRAHEGIDVSAPQGSPIIAPAGGTVVKVGVEGGYGNILEIDHGNGIVTRYAHCSRILVRAGQRVERSDVIAKVGSTGLSVGPHLHYEIIVNGKNVDPLKYVLPANAVTED
jgi:murein DD-endopeptidase MepM/ murein hydrolase activator NlpD